MDTRSTELLGPQSAHRAPQADAEDASPATTIFADPTPRLAGTRQAQSSIAGSSEMSAHWVHRVVTAPWVKQARRPSSTEEIAKEMRARPSEFIVHATKPFKHDTLDRERRVRALCRLLQQIESPAVIAVNGRFGSGKSAFLRMCAAHLRYQRVSVVEFNAWQQCHTRMPLVDLVSALARDMTAGKRLCGIATNLAWRAANVATRGLIVQEDFSKPEDAPSFEAWTQIEERRKEFRNELAKIRKANHSQLVVLIDELDRCLPTHALEILDAARHLFDVTGVVVVLGINRDELCHRVKSLYGESCDAEVYLRRFVDLSIDLPDASSELLDSFMEETLAAAGLKDRLQTPENSSDSMTSVSSGSMIRVLAEHSDMSLRDIEQMVHQLAGVLTLVPGPEPDEVNGDRLAWEQVTVALFVLRVAAPSAYRNYSISLSGVLEAAKAMMDALSIDSNRARARRPVLRLLTLVIGTGVHGDEDEFERSFVAAGVGDIDLARAVWKYLPEADYSYKPVALDEVISVIDLAAETLHI